MSDHIEKAQGVPVRFWQQLGTDVAQGLRFYSRLPVPALPWEQNPHALPDFPQIARALPLTGLALGIVPALVMGLALLFGLGPWIAAVLSVTAVTVTTGAFHEDGLADTADSFGGSTKERRLEIMKDSRIGSFGASALFLALAFRIAALATLAERTHAPAVFAAILMAASLSRTSGLMLLVFLPPARSEGASYAVGQPTRETFWFAAGLASVGSVVLGAMGGLPLSGILLMLALTALSGFAMTRFAARHVQGQTGDIAGATQQVAEIAALIGLLTVIQP